MAQISHLIRVKGRLDRVYDAVASTAGITQWFTESRSNNYEIGGELRLVFPSSDVTFVVSQMEQNTKIIWHCTSEENPWYQTNIVFAFSHHTDITTVTFDHLDWPEITDHFRDCSMSWAYFLESLKSYIEDGVGTPESVTPACGAPACHGTS